MSIYDNVRNIRLSKGLKQSYVASKLGIAPNNYGKLERGEIQLTVERVTQLAEIFEVEENYIYTYKNEIEKNGLKKREKFILEAIHSAEYNYVQILHYAEIIKAILTKDKATYDKLEVSYREYVASQNKLREKKELEIKNKYPDFDIQDLWDFNYNLTLEECIDELISKCSDFREKAELVNNVSKAGHKLFDHHVYQRNKNNGPKEEN